MRIGLKHRLPRSTHIFEDVLDVFGNGKLVYDQIMSLDSYEEKLAYASELHVHGEAYCSMHDRMCPIYTNASSRVGGIPCQDYSRAGRQAGVLGPHFPPALGFGAKAALTRSPLVCIECVPGLPRHVPKDACGPSFAWILETLVSPEMVGFNHIRRDRLSV